MRDPTQTPIRVHGDRMAHHLEEREIGVAVRVGRRGAEIESLLGGELAHCGGLALGMAYHFAFMWIFAVNGCLYVLYTLVSGEWRELLPNAWPAIVVEGSLRVAFAILLGAVLSFLGFGVQPPAADWGLMISEARPYLESAPWIALAPGIAMSLTVIGINLFGDGLRQALDPRLNSSKSG